MLDSFSYRYQDYDIERFYYMKIWPQQTQASLTEGKQLCEAKREEFNNKLENDKEAFKNQINVFRQEFDFLKEF